jgi:hypothetical protein
MHSIKDAGLTILHKPYNMNPFDESKHENLRSD